MNNLNFVSSGKSNINPNESEYCYSNNQEVKNEIYRIAKEGTMRMYLDCPIFELEEDGYLYWITGYPENTNVIYRRKNDSK